MDDKELVTGFQKVRISNSCPWEHILQCIGYNFDHPELNQYVTATQIKQAKQSWKGSQLLQFEPRLLCKHDDVHSRPQVFKDYNIHLLSVKNGMYLITSNTIYVHLDVYSGPAKAYKRNATSALLSIGDSETSLLDNLRYCGALEDIIGEEILFGPLLGGRHRCKFKTKLGQSEVSIDGSQYETDGCYETENKVCVIEVKSKPMKSFNIRQLYFPFRVVQQSLERKKVHKDVMCLYIIHDKEHIHINKYVWDDYFVMMDIKLQEYYKLKFH